MKPVGSAPLRIAPAPTPRCVPWPAAGRARSWESSGHQHGLNRPKHPVCTRGMKELPRVQHPVVTTRGQIGAGGSLLHGLAAPLLPTREALSTASASSPSRGGAASSRALLCGYFMVLLILGASYSSCSPCPQHGQASGPVSPPRGPRLRHKVTALVAPGPLPPGPRQGVAALPRSQGDRSGVKSRKAAASRERAGKQRGERAVYARTA